MKKPCAKHWLVGSRFSYTGYDPTADSLHLGHLHLDDVAFTSRPQPYARWQRICPQIRPSKRLLNVVSNKRNCGQECLLHSRQLSCFLDFENGDNSAEMVNNYDWFGSISFIDFLRDVGNTLRSMLYTEFAYQIMQGYVTSYVLNQEHNVTLQIGGSDQWGNMTAGTELMRRA